MQQHYYGRNVLITSCSIAAFNAPSAQSLAAHLQIDHIDVATAMLHALLLFCTHATLLFVVRSRRLFKRLFVLLAVRAAAVNYCIALA